MYSVAVNHSTRVRQRHRTRRYHYELYSVRSYALFCRMQGFRAGALAPTFPREELLRRCPLMLSTYMT